MKPSALPHDSRRPCSLVALSSSVAISRRSSMFTSSGISVSCREPGPLLFTPAGQAAAALPSPAAGGSARKAARAARRGQPPGRAERGKCGRSPPHLGRGRRRTAPCDARRGDWRGRLTCRGRGRAPGSPRTSLPEAAMGGGASLGLSAELLLLLLLAAGGAAGAPPDDCRLPYVVGKCRAAFPRWWYNATSQTCQNFIFGGCGGNSNNFLSKTECFRACATGGEEKMTRTPLTSQGAAQGPATEAMPTSRHRHQQAEKMDRFQEYCAAPRVTGRCRASFPRWFFDTETRTCKTFIYGGCGGNRNNYLLEEDCLSQCAEGGELLSQPGEDPKTHGHLFPDSELHSTRAVVLAVVLALLLAALVLVVIKICRQSRELSLSTVWSTMDDKELLMRSGYTL